MRIGIDLGGTKIEGIAIDEKGVERHRLRVPTPKGEYAAIIKALSELVGDIEKTVGLKISHVFPNDYRQAVGAINKGQPMAEALQGRLPESFHAFARQLAGQSAPATAQETSGGLWGWLTPKRSLSS